MYKTIIGLIMITISIKINKTKNKNENVTRCLCYYMSMGLRVTSDTRVQIFGECSQSTDCSIIVPLSDSAYPSKTTYLFRFMLTRQYK